jgi:hypothetical protein
MHRPIITILLLSAVLLACGANDKEKTTADPIDASNQKAPGKAKGDQEPSAKKTAKADTTPACMHCGATCGLAAICVCEPGTSGWVPDAGRAGRRHGNRHPGATIL